METNLEQIFVSRLVAEEKLRDKNREPIALGHPGNPRRGLLHYLIRIFAE